MRISARYIIKLRDGVIAEVKLTKACFKGKFTAKFLSTAEKVAELVNGTHQTKSINRPPIKN
jgi:hypothetical protein